MISMGRSKGVALLMVRGLTLVISLFLVSISYRHQLDVSRDSSALRRDQVILLALSAESWARQILRDDLSANSTDSWNDDWAQPIPLLPVEGGTLSGCLRDMQGRFNLNNLQNYNSELWDADLTSLFSSDLEAFLNLLALLDLDASEVRAALLIDWMDADSDLLIGSSAEDPDYLYQNPQRLAANRLLANIEEITAVEGFSAADLIVLRHFVSALPTSTAVNINSAEPLVLMALSPALDEFIIEAIVENRPFESVAEFYDFVAGMTGYMTIAELQEQLPPSMIAVTSQFFELRARVDLDGESVNLRSLIYRGGGEQADVYSREFQTIPSVLSVPESGIVSSFDCALPEWLIDEN